MNLFNNYNLLINTVRDINGVLSIGKSGGENIPAQNESDIDIFIFCSQIPDAKTRKESLSKLDSAISNMKISETGGTFWGVCDFITLNDTEICLMYFTISDMDNEIESVLNGSRLERENEYFYPTGRCATFLSMYILYDKNGYITSVKEKLSEYPASLSEKLYNYHIGKMNNEEDFERAVTRQEVVFYHSVLENSIDHFLQALFALNKCFLPSRKRTLQFIECFRYKPLNCSERLLKVIEFGSSAKTLAQSYDIWFALCKEFSNMAIRA